MMVMELVKAKFPGLKIYGALDPYRQSIRDEVRYAESKKLAGAEGFFTQPIFDERLLGIYLDQLKDVNIFVGISPVLNQHSLNYWSIRNQVPIPAGFHTTMEDNIKVGKKIIKLSKKNKSSLYIMPMRTPIFPYLERLLS